MNTEQHQITVHGLIVDVVRKDIKNLHLAVYPPAGRVRVAAPLQVNDDAVGLFSISRLSWIKRQQAKFEAQELQSAREYVSGESHYYQGNRYLLNVMYDKGRSGVVIRNHKIMDLIVRPDREMGSGHWRAGGRMGCEADENQVGHVQYRGPAHLVKSRAN